MESFFSSIAQKTPQNPLCQGEDTTEDTTKDRSWGAREPGNAWADVV